MNNKKIAKSKADRTATSCNIQLVIGGIFFFVFFGTLISSIYDYVKGLQDSAMSVVITFFVLSLGVAIWIFFSIKKLVLVKRFKQYSVRLATDPNHSIDKLAFAIKKPVNAVRKNLAEMIKREFFTNTFIDDDTNCMVFPMDMYGVSELDSTNIQYKVEKCPGCGAPNKVVVGRVSKCEYCGSSIM